MTKKQPLLILLLLFALVLVACQPAATPEPEDPAPPEDEPTDEPADDDMPAVDDYEGEMIISVWGGSTEEWIRSTVEPKFNEMYPNVTVVYDVGGMSDRYNKLLAQKETPEIDLFVSSVEALVSAINEDLVSPLNRDNIPNMDALHEWAVPLPEYGAAYATIVLGLGYNPDFFGDDPPTSWDDLWRPDVQGKIAVPAIGHSMMPEFIAMAAELNGGDAQNPEPGFEYLAELQPGAQSFFYTNWNAQFDAEDIVLAVDFDYYIQGMADTGSNIAWVMPEEGGFLAQQHLAVAAGTENQEMVEYFINLMLSEEIQQSVAEDLLNTPARADIEVSPELAARLSAYGDGLNDATVPDYSYAAEVRPAWTESMNEIVAPQWAE